MYLEIHYFNVAVGKNSEKKRIAKRVTFALDVKDNSDETTSSTTTAKVCINLLVQGLKLIILLQFCIVNAITSLFYNSLH